MTMYLVLISIFLLVFLPNNINQFINLGHKTQQIYGEHQKEVYIKEKTPQ